MISIIIPIFNEFKNINLLHSRLLNELLTIDRIFEVIFIDDGSFDGSSDLLTKICSNDSRFKLIKFRRNFGQTAAISAGIYHSTGEIIIPMDGDLQNDPKDIISLIKKIEEGYDVVSGWRKNRKDSFIKRNFPSMVANRLISFISGVKLHDYGCSLKAFRSEVIKNVRLYGEMHRFMPIYASWMGAKVTEIVVSHNQRIHGVSKYGLERVVKVLLDLLVVKFLAQYSTKPIYVFGGFGITIIFLSLIFGSWALWLKLFKGVSFIQTPLLLITFLSFIIGFISILMGLLAELIMRTYYEAQDKKIYSIKTMINIKI
jgi:glycosyltransferase involved in cell wall biosynthesis